MAEGQAALWQLHLGPDFPGFKVWAYVAGTTTEQTIWDDAAKSDAIVQPFVAGVDGWAKFYGDGDYRLVIQDRDGVTLNTLDPIRITDDVATVWEGSHGTTLPAVTDDNKWHLFTKHDSNDLFKGLFLNNGTSYADISGGINAGVFNVQTFGAVGDGVTDDTVAIQAAIDAIVLAAKGVLLFPPGTYKITAELTAAFTDTLVTGKGATLTGSFGYGLLKLLATTNTVIEHIVFNNTHTNAVEDTGKSVVYSANVAIDNLTIRDCTFKCPNAYTSAFTIYARTSTADTTGSIKGLKIVNNLFENVGRICITLMNRSTTADAYNATRDILVENNRVETSGAAGANGFFISLDGSGSKVSISNNHIKDALLIGIENTGWTDCVYERNIFSGTANKYAPFGFSAADVTRPMTHQVIKGNITKDEMQSACNFYEVDDSTFSNNVFLKDTTGAASAVNVRGNRNNFTDERYESKGANAMIFGTGGSQAIKDNIVSNCRLSTASSSANTSVVRFWGSGVTLNIVRDCELRKGTGGFWADQASSAAGNAVENVTDENGVPQDQHTLFTMPDSNTSFTDVFSYATIRIDGTLTAGRTLDFPKTHARRHKTIFNNTGQAITVGVNGTAVDSIAAGATKVVAYNVAINSWRVL